MDKTGEPVPEPIACRLYSGKFMSAFRRRFIENWLFKRLNPV
jgi:hypothetical protein